MATLADLIGMRDALEAARFSGVRKVVYGDTETEYKSDAEMKRALLDLNRKITAASGPASSPFVTFSTSKGL
ncbi:phage head-tail joining protein [Azospirillum brasilense]|uniref:phage head-tail joining protein n=1 Tax=Azospirillum brasilense TaxID=192 RepID=UPI000E6982AA|nr:hypothetical protein [Azospirillum brasilense]NUB25728.1 hypothetical protein [Azospirillum brasilense]NUB33866.1 hypothetical protein [Azospirillum brasilense]RIW07759.1 hypothetical protein D2T81_02665 [Azospirillum brasilense]